VHQFKHCVASQPPLHDAVEAGDHKMVNAFLTASSLGHGVNAHYKGWTPLMKTAERHLYALVWKGAITLILINMLLLDSTSIHKLAAECHAHVWHHRDMIRTLSLTRICHINQILSQGRDDKSGTSC
jgi:hypothetical protein